MQSNNAEFSEHITCKPQFETSQKGLLVRSPAKINLSLLIAGKRPDGFHNLETVMTKVTWYDEILINSNQSPGIDFSCCGPQWAPKDKNNLVYRAAKLVLEKNHKNIGVKITLKKMIPAGTGLGSASSNAAATILGLNKFLNLSLQNETMSEIAVKLGSDVPFFLGGPIAFCTGKGEKIQKINEIFNFSALLILPFINVSTARVYKNYKHDSTEYRRLSKIINGHIAKNRIDFISKICANMLAKSCYNLLPEMVNIRNQVESFGIKPVCLTGSGSAMYCIFDNINYEQVKICGKAITNKIGCSCVIINNNIW